MSGRDIFLEALEQPTPEARSAYLDRVCSGDAALRAEVEALLKNHRDDDSLGGGEDDSRQWFADQIRARHPKIKLLQPKPGEAVEV
jgi:hypothetical protein